MDPTPFATPTPGAPMPTAEALALFERLPPIECSRLLGAWHGAGFPTGHPLDGALEAFGWAGKRFDSEEEGHPLVFRRGTREFCVHPVPAAAGMPLVMRWPALKRGMPAALVRALLPLVATRRSRARLRMLQHRGVLTAAMLYDQVPIIDVFRDAGGGTLLGLMDRKGMEQPFFFLLRRAGA